MADMDESTGLPKTVKLGDVLNKIELAPSQVGELLRGLAFGHLGGASDPMARTLLQHANDVADPATYGNKPGVPYNPQARWAATSPGSPPPTSPVPAAGAAQAQSALPPFGTTNEPSWMADARAAGWNAPDDTAKDQTDKTPEPAWMADARRAGWQGNESKLPPSWPPSTSTASTSGRHFDSTQGKWVDNETGQPIDVTGSSTSATPPQPSAPRQ